MIFRPDATAFQTRRTGRIRLNTSRVVARGPLTDLERRAVESALQSNEHALAVVRGAECDDVYLWVATEQRALQFIHAVEGVFLLRLMPLTHLRSLQLLMQGDWASMQLTSRKRTYVLERLPREDALHFAQQLGVAELLITENARSA
jgi:hypothetical protein